MKKIKSIAVTLLVVVLLTGCGSAIKNKDKISIKNNSYNPERVSHYENFLFDNIVSITYGRNELYKKDENSNIIIKNKNKNKDYER